MGREVMIPVTGGYTATVDEADAEAVAAHRWRAYPHHISGHVYARTTVRNCRGRQTTIALHRFILGLDNGDPRQVDHINRNTLDNRKQNLRIASASTNQANTKKRDGCSSSLRHGCD